MSDIIIRVNEKGLRVNFVLVNSICETYVSDEDKERLKFFEIIEKKNFF